METAKLNLTVVGDGKPNALRAPVEESTLVHKHVLRGPF